MKWLCLMVLTLGLSSAARAADISTSTFQGQIADWSLIQAAGGLELGTAIQTSSSTWKFALACDLSTHNSGTIIRKMLVAEENGSIYLSLLVTHSAWTLTPERGQCHDILIDSKPGTHLVFYRDDAGKTYPLGNVRFLFDANVFKSSRY